MKKTYVGGRHCGAVPFEADLDLDLAELAAAVRFFDGRHDKWEAPPAVTDHL